jgi:REP element-mobilizing transposase RayT
MGGIVMPQSRAQSLVHAVFSTNNREPLIADDFRDSLHAVIGGIVREHGGTLLLAGSAADHIHLLIAFPRTIAPAELIQNIKTGSSNWANKRMATPGGFHWQAGYGVFSISPAHRSALEKYIADQHEHHKKVTFQDEYRRLLKKYGIDYVEKYVWD